MKSLRLKAGSTFSMYLVNYRDWIDLSNRFVALAVVVLVKCMPVAFIIVDQGFVVVVFVFFAVVYYLFVIH